MRKRCRLLVVPVVVLGAAAPAAAQPAPAPEPAQPAPDAPTPSTEPTVPPAPTAPPGTGQPPPPPAPAESSKPGAAPGPGEVTSKWSMTIYGFAEVDLMHDTTQTFSDSPGNGPIARPTGLAYNNGRTQTTARNSRLGVRMSAPEFEGMKASGNIEGDFMGNQPSPVSEASFVNNGTFRVRAAYAKVETEYVDLLAGQYYFLFGEQPFFFPMSTWFFGLPNQAFGRTQQFRLSHTFKSDAASVDLAVSAQRPPQRDSEIPDFQGGLKIGVNGWKGVHAGGSGYAAFDPLTIAASGSFRHFRVNDFATAPTALRTINGWGISLDGMIPVIPAKSAKDKGNALTLTGSFVQGSGIGDLLGGLTGGAAFPNVPTMTGALTGTYAANIDPGILQYDTAGNLRAIKWQTFMVGAQYFLPPSGRISIGANYTHGKSDNITDGLTATAPMCTQCTLGSVFKESQYFEAVAFGDLTPAVRIGAAWQRIQQTRGDEAVSKHNRLELAVYFFF